MYLFTYTWISNSDSLIYFDNALRLDWFVWDLGKDNYAEEVILTSDLENFVDVTAFPLKASDSPSMTTYSNASLGTASVAGVFNNPHRHEVNPFLIKPGDIVCTTSGIITENTDWTYVTKVTSSKVYVADPGWAAGKNCNTYVSWSLYYRLESWGVTGYGWETKPALNTGPYLCTQSGNLYTGVPTSFSFFRANLEYSIAMIAQQGVHLDALDHVIESGLGIWDAEGSETSVVDADCGSFVAFSNSGFNALPQDLYPGLTTPEYGTGSGFTYDPLDWAYHNPPLDHTTTVFNAGVNGAGYIKTIELIKMFPSQTLIGDILSTSHYRYWESTETMITQNHAETAGGTVKYDGPGDGTSDQLVVEGQMFPLGSVYTRHFIDKDGQETHEDRPYVKGEFCHIVGKRVVQLFTYDHPSTNTFAQNFERDTPKSALTNDRSAALEDALKVLIDKTASSAEENNIIHVYGFIVRLP